MVGVGRVGGIMCCKKRNIIYTNTILKGGWSEFAPTPAVAPGQICLTTKHIFTGSAQFITVLSSIQCFD